MTNREPQPVLHNIIVVVLLASSVAFVALLFGWGSGFITEPETDSASNRYGSGPRPQFVITAVVFGEEGYVEVRNDGDAPGTLVGYFLCQRPLYAGLMDIGLAPGEALWVTPGDEEPSALPDGVIGVQQAHNSIGVLTADGGEMGLYLGNKFADAGAIQSYVEWGSSGHGRASVAVEAGIWPRDGFVAVPSGSRRISFDSATGGLAGWSSGP